MQKAPDALWRIDPEHDPRSGNLPGGHPELKSFLGVPLFHCGDVGTANWTGGYDEGMVEFFATAVFLQPLFANAGAIPGMRLDAERRAAEEASRVSEERLRNNASWDTMIGKAKLEKKGERDREPGTRSLLPRVARPPRRQ